jgi:hypothetical protein
MDLFLWFFLAQELCLQMTLLPESSKELKIQLLTGCTACNRGRSYWSGIFSAQIWGIPFYSPLLRCYWRTTGSTCTTMPARPFLDWYGSFMATWSSSRRMTETHYIDHGQRTADSNWSTAYQCCDRSSYVTNLRSSFSWWGSQHWFPAWFLWDETIERRQVPFPDQHRYFCSYAPIFSKGCSDKPLASSSLEWAYSQKGHPSLCHCDADSFLLV